MSGPLTEVKVYPWKSAAVISTVVLGALILIIFGLWEAYATLPEPVVPVKLFKNIHWVAASCLLGLGASIYYGELDPSDLENVLHVELTSTSYGDCLA